MPGQAYESGIGFIQNYFGQPLALIVVCAVFVPIYQRLKVYTAYQYLGERFDRKTQLLGAFLFLIQRGIAAGITIYAPAIILSALLGWRLNLTIWLAGGLVIVYTVIGGTKIVSITQRYQMIVILVGMAIAFAVAVYRLSPDLSLKTRCRSRVKWANWSGQFLGRPAQAIYILVGPDRRLFPRAVVFRSGPIAGATISRRRLAQRESPRVALQRRGEGADAVFHSAARRDCFHVLPIRKAAGLLQSTCVPARDGEAAMRHS
jgi:Na+(H+)/acetate symporter ActP